MTDNSVVRMVKHGPPNSAGTIQWLIGMWLWWRTWGLSLVATAPLLAAALTFTHVGTPAAVVVGPLAGLVCGALMLQISPKYNVTKNY